ncbi:hypothetical protein EBB06_01490 [Crenobacter cavernae]|uniref:Uncharacterized protein n=2 Tax=Crenobacter cavernae TaxID=2290923 RepID=A0ABY0FIX4_9NEIS|nr:hypothetical protein EBB06_01490 [Crenobacter cavernae]
MNMKSAAALALKSPQAYFAKPNTERPKKKVFNDDLLMPFYAAVPAKSENKARESVRKDSAFAWFSFF